MTTPGVTKCDVVITVEVSAGGIAAVDGQRDADDQARSGAAQPQDRGGDLPAPPEPADRLSGDGIVHAELAVGDHSRDHGRFDGAGADRVDADAARCVFERGALGHSQDAVLGVEPAERADGAVDQGGHLIFVGDVAGDAEGAMPGGGQLVGCAVQRRSTSASTTAAPVAAKAWAVSRPMPAAAPVTSAAWSWKS